MEIEEIEAIEAVEAVENGGIGRRERESGEVNCSREVCY
jgi:hypothetical protein